MVVKYIIEREFTHVITDEKMYRVKRVFESGGVDYVVCTKQEYLNLTNS